MINREIIKNSDHKLENLYQLVLDVERYPEFIPWCGAARITEHLEHYFLADLVIKFTGFREKYTSRVTTIPYNQKQNYAEITVDLVEGPFHSLVNKWTFSKEKQGTKIEFQIAFSFKSTILEKVMSVIFEKAFVKMIDAFEARADNIYNNKDSKD
jgi:coenzyme Q-binding protein COQ10